MMNNLPNFPNPEENQITPLQQPNNTVKQELTNSQQTQQINPPQQPNQQTKNYKQQSPKFPFYTGSSALIVSYGEQCIYWELAPALEQKRYDWKNNKIYLKMGIEEIDNILECLEAYKTNGTQAFQQVAKFLQPKNKQPGTLQFYHPSQKAVTLITVGISKSGLPSISVMRNENQTNIKKIYFPILPVQLRTFIRVHEVYSSEALKRNKS